MDFGEDKLDFQEIDRRYAELKSYLDARDITEQEFDEQLERLMIQDQRGRWWAKSPTTGEWHYYSENRWIPGTPPGYAPQREELSDVPAGATQGEQLIPPTEPQLSPGYPPARPAIQLLMSLISVGVGVVLLISIVLVVVNSCQGSSVTGGGETTIRGGETTTRVGEPTIVNGISK